MAAEWLALQDDEAGWSTNSRHEIVRDASHYIQFDRPDVVVRAVHDVVNAARSSHRLPQRLSPFVQAARNTSP